MSAQGDGPLGRSNDLMLLAPRFRQVVEAAIAECNSKNLNAIAFETYRSQELQAVYYAKGRTTIPPTKPVTYAPTNLHSWHGYGLAVDVIHRHHHWAPPDGWFDEVAEIFIRHGCKWGGQWTRPDLPHFQWHLCKPSPSDEARRIILSQGVNAIWEVLDAV